MAKPKPPPGRREIRRFLRAAEARLEEAQFLLANQYTTAAVYLAGYAVECAFKALILSSEPASRHVATVLSFRGAKAHDFEWLRKQLARRHFSIPAPMEQRWKQLYELLESLPQETRSEISLMFLMTPREAANRYKHMNWEYENPEPTPDPTDRNGEPGPENTRPTRARKRAMAKRTGR